MPSTLLPAPSTRIMNGTRTPRRGSATSAGPILAGRADVLRVLDSTVLIDYLRGRPAVARVSALRATGDVPATTAINVEEIVRGLRAAEAKAAAQLFSGLVVLPIDAKVAWHAGDWRREFASRGVTLWQADCLIAAAAHVHSGTLVTGNPKDFPMPELAIDHWPVGA
jgi:predicted nucleic acid-binding protein